MEKHFHYWLVLLAFSVISLIATVKHINDINDLGMGELDWSTEQRWVVSVASISSCLAFLACIFHIALKEAFAGTLLEFGWILVLLILWCAGLPTLFDNEHNLAVTRWGIISNGNIFFASVGALLVLLFLFSKHLKILLKLSDEDSVYLFHWILFVGASTAVVACGSVYIADFDCSDLDDDEACRRSTFGSTLGAISIAFGLVMMFVKLPELFVQVGSVLLMVSWAVAAAYLTFGKGPATQVGTMYFAVWICFLLLLDIVAPIFTDLIKSLNKNPDEHHDDNKAEKDVKVEEKVAEEEMEQAPPANV